MFLKNDRGQDFWPRFEYNQGLILPYTRLNGYRKLPGHQQQDEINVGGTKTKHKFMFNKLSEDSKSHK